MLFFLFFLLVFWDKVSCIPGWPPTHYVAEGDLELLIFLPRLPKSWEFTGIHHHTRQDSISKNYKKGTNKKKNIKPYNSSENYSKFPRQLLEVGIPFYRKLYFSEQSNYFISIRKVEKTWKLSTITKGEANILLVNLHGPHWAISSHEKDWTQHPSQMWNGAKPKVQGTPNCWQGN